MPTPRPTYPYSQPRGWPLDIHAEPLGWLPYLLPRFARLGPLCGRGNEYRIRVPGRMAVQRLLHWRAPGPSLLAIGSLIVGLLMAVPAAAQVDFTGEWGPIYHEDRPERLPGPELGDYTGLPINDAARLAADSWDANRISVVTQYQCRPHSSDYGLRGLGNMRVWRELDPATHRLIAFHTYMPAWGSTRTIWMDGRPHPSEHAEHTFQGFSTGIYEGNTLVVTTTHLKVNYYRRNGVPSSDRRTVTEYWTRHDDILTIVTVVDDPVYLTESLVRSQNWFLDPGQELPPLYCETAPEVLPDTPDTVPHYLPGTNAYLTEFADWYGLPLEGARGGAETMYPEYRLRMGPPNAPPPDRCERFCICSSADGCPTFSTPPR